MKIFDAIPGEERSAFLSRMEKERLNGKVGIAVYCGISFEIGPNMSAYDSYEEARIKSELRRKESKERERIEKVKMLDKKVELFMTKTDLKDIELLEFIHEISGEAINGFVPSEAVLNSLFTFLTNCGYTPLDEQMCYKTDSLLTSLPGYKGYKVYNSGVFFPENVKFFDLELDQAIIYVIGNFLSQIQKGKIDPSNYDLTIYLKDQKEKEKSNMQM